MDPGVAAVWPEVKNNTVFDWEIGDKAATERVRRRRARHKLTVVNNRIVVNSMEARAAVADFERRRPLDTDANTQGGWL